MRFKRLSTLSAVLVSIIVATDASAAGGIGPIGSVKPPVQTDPCIGADVVYYASSRVTSSAGGDSKASVFLDSWTLSFHESTWGNLYQREDNYPGVAITRDTILSADGSLVVHGTSVFTDITTFEGAHGFFSEVVSNGSLVDLKATYVWSYDFWNSRHTGQLRMCMFLKK
ncbi:MAG TPA: hypothetical protein VFG09_11810 [Thermodesulfovibrionales bacterium]|nr:hypothetical protein [Thermodesulfovibrionales bacterium]